MTPHERPKSKSLWSYLPAFKLPAWAIIAGFLVFGWRHARQQDWLGLAFLTVIDIFSAIWIAVDRRRGEPLGNTWKEIFHHAKEFVKETIMDNALKAVGIPERYVEGHRLSEDTRKGEHDGSLGVRLIFNHLWSLILLGFCVYILSHGWK
jgi:hypothetical protein